MLRKWEEDEGEDDCEVPGELARLLLQEERAIQPHEEPVEFVNLGSEIDKKEVKIGANCDTVAEPTILENAGLRFAFLFAKCRGKQESPSTVISSNRKGKKHRKNLFSRYSEYGG